MNKLEINISVIKTYIEFKNTSMLFGQVKFEKTDNDHPYGQWSARLTNNNEEYKLSFLSPQVLKHIRQGSVIDFYSGIKHILTAEIV